MIAAAILLAVSVILLCAVVYLLVDRARGIRTLIGRQVVLYTRDDRSLRGILLHEYTDCLVLTSFEYLDEANPAALPGEAVVPRTNVSWMQKLGEVT